MSKNWEELLVWKLTGPRFDEHWGVDLADLSGLVALRSALIEVAKVLWKRRNNRKRIPDLAEERVELRIKSFDDGCQQTVVWLGKPPPMQATQGDFFGAQILDDATSFLDSLHDAAGAIEDALGRVADGDPLPEWFPREVLWQLHLTGKRLHPDERWSVIALRRRRGLADDLQDGPDELAGNSPGEDRNERFYENDLPNAARVVSRPPPLAPPKRIDLSGSPEVAGWFLNPVQDRPRDPAVLDVTLRARLEELGQPKAQGLRSVQRTLSGEVRMVDVDGLVQGGPGVVRLRPDGNPDDLVEVLFSTEHENAVTHALYEHKTLRLRVRGEAQLDERGRMKRFYAKKVAMITAAPAEAPSEALFERLAVENPARLLAMLISSELKPSMLTYAAEIAGRNLPTHQVAPLLIKLLSHESAVVREGAVYGLEEHSGQEVTNELRRISETDPSPGVRTAAKGALQAR